MTFPTDSCPNCRREFKLLPGMTGALCLCTARPVYRYNDGRPVPAELVPCPDHGPLTAEWEAGLRDEVSSPRLRTHWDWQTLAIVAVLREIDRLRTESGFDRVVNRDDQFVRSAGVNDDVRAAVGLEPAEHLPDLGGPVELHGGSPGQGRIVDG